MGLVIFSRAYGHLRAWALLLFCLTRILAFICLLAVHLRIFLEIGRCAALRVILPDNDIITTSSFAMVNTLPLLWSFRRICRNVVILFVAPDNVLQICVGVGHPMREESLAIAIVINLLYFWMTWGATTLLGGRDHSQLLCRVYMFDHVSLWSAHINDLIIADIGSINIVGCEYLLVHTVASRCVRPSVLSNISWHSWLQRCLIAPTLRVDLDTVSDISNDALSVRDGVIWGAPAVCIVLRLSFASPSRSLIVAQALGRLLIAEIIRGDLTLLVVLIVLLNGHGRSRRLLGQLLNLRRVCRALVRGVGPLGQRAALLSIAPVTISNWPSIVAHQIRRRDSLRRRGGKLILRRASILAQDWRVSSVNICLGALLAQGRLVVRGAQVAMISLRGLLFQVSYLLLQQILAVARRWHNRLLIYY